jgi:hypothetical protein
MVERVLILAGEPVITRPIPAASSGNGKDTVDPNSCGGLTSGHPRLAGLHLDAGANANPQ